MIKDNSDMMVWIIAVVQMTNGLQIVNLRKGCVFTLLSAIISQVSGTIGTVQKYTRVLQFPSAVISLVLSVTKSERFSPKKASSVFVFVCLFCF